MESRSTADTVCFPATNAAKADYGEIPELKERYAALQAAIRNNKKKDAGTRWWRFVWQRSVGPT